MNKRSQITQFIALGIVVVIIVAVILFSQTSIKEEQTEKEITESTAVTANGLAVSQFVKGCMDTTAKTGVLYAGLQGGYTDLPPSYFSVAYSDVPYYYNNGNRSIVQLSDIETQLERFINSNIKACINDFQTFTEKGVVVSAGTPTADVTLNPATGMSVLLNYDLSVGTEGNQEILSKFKASYNYRMGAVREVAQKIVDKVSQNPKLIPLSELTDIGRTYNVNIDSISYGPDTVIYMIEDPNTVVEGDTPLIFLFAVRQTPTNRAPVILVDETKLTGKTGEEFTLIVGATDADNDPVEFDVESDAADIDPLLGKLEFTPAQAGSYPMTIIATDGIDTAEKNITITIT